MVERYTFGLSAKANDTGALCAEIVRIKDPDGDYVLYTDYADLDAKYQALYRECTELARENKRLKEGLERIIHEDEGCEYKPDFISEIAKEALEG